MLFGTDLRVAAQLRMFWVGCCPDGLGEAGKASTVCCHEVYHPVSHHYTQCHPNTNTRVRGHQPNTPVATERAAPTTSQ